MKQFSIFRMLWFIATLALLFGLTLNLVQNRQNAHQAKVLEYSLECQHAEYQMAISAIVQCDSQPRFEHLELSRFLDSLVGDTYHISVDEIHQRDTPPLIFLIISAQVKKGFRTKYGDHERRKAALFLLNKESNTVIDAMTTSQYGGGDTYSSPDNHIWLKFTDDRPRIKTSRTGFVPAE